MVGDDPTESSGKVMAMKTINENTEKNDDKAK